KPRGAKLQCAAVITGVGGRFVIREAVFLQDRRIGGIGCGWVRARLWSPLHLPSSELLREDSGPLGCASSTVLVSREGDVQRTQKEGNDTNRAENAHERNLEKELFFSLDHIAGPKVSCKSRNPKGALPGSQS